MSYPVLAIQRAAVHLGAHCSEGIVVVVVVGKREGWVVDVGVCVRNQWVSVGVERKRVRVRIWPGCKGICACIGGVRVGIGEQWIRVLCEGVGEWVDVDIADVWVGIGERPGGLEGVSLDLPGVRVEGPSGAQLSARRCLPRAGGVHSWVTHATEKKSKALFSAQ